MGSQDDMPQPPHMPLDFEVVCEVALTPQQQAIVKKETQRDMDVLVLGDADGTVTSRMQDATPDEFTLLAIRQAKMLNEYDAQYRDYLEALAAWQESLQAPDPMEQQLEAASIAIQQEAERLKLFYMQEAQACTDARAIAKMAWGGKKQES